MIPDVSGLARLLADPGRARMLTYLMHHETATATQLANSAGLSAQAASNHLTQLAHNQLVTYQVEGRFRHYRLFDAQIAHVIESLMVCVRQHSTSPIFMDQDDIQRLRLARTCYDHMAGILGVRLKDAFITHGFIVDTPEGMTLTPQGHQWLHDQLSIEVSCLQDKPCMQSCADWSERSYHLAGSLGRELHRAFRQRGYIKATQRTNHLQITSAGHTFLYRQLGILISL